MPKKKILLAGAGGHAKVVADLLERTGGWDLAGAVDRDPRGDAARDSGLTILGDDDALPALLASGVRCAAVGMGSNRDTGPRAGMRRELERLGFTLPALVHPSAVVSPKAVLGPGTQVLAGALINAGAVLGAGVVVNTGAIVEHDCRLGDDSFVGPGAVLAGGVTVGPGAFIGLGARVLPGVNIGEKAVVGAGAVVVADAAARALVVGVPARPRRSS